MTVGVFDFDRAMKGLRIKKVKWEEKRSPESRGYSWDRKIAINENSPFIQKTHFHEMGHVVLGHTEGDFLEKLKGQLDISTKAIHEIEAESVALICIGVCGHDGHQDGKDYIKGWLKAVEDFNQIDMDKVKAAASKIIKAGMGE